MKTYIRVHVVKAEPMTRGDFHKSKGWAEKGWNMPEGATPDDPGYKVAYKDGYVSWCPKDSFEESGRPIDGMTFGQAIEALKMGKKVSRKGWNGKGMWLWLKPAKVLKTDMCRDELLKGTVEANGGELLALGTVCMYTHDSTGRKAVLTGWLASQSDILSEDWTIVE